MSKNRNKVETFLEQMRHGDITDFRPYLTVKPAAIQVAMARNAILVDELSKQKNPNVWNALIENGDCQDRYEDWAKTPAKTFERQFVFTLTILIANNTFPNGLKPFVFSLFLERIVSNHQERRRGDCGYPLSNQGCKFNPSYLTFRRHEFVLGCAYA